MLFNAHYGDAVHALGKNFPPSINRGVKWRRWLSEGKQPRKRDFQKRFSGPRTTHTVSPDALV
jgi:hypothetical protein